MASSRRCFIKWIAFFVITFLFAPLFADGQTEVDTASLVSTASTDTITISPTTIPPATPTPVPLDSTTSSSLNVAPIAPSPVTTTNTTASNVGTITVTSTHVSPTTAPVVAPSPKRTIAPATDSPAKGISPSTNVNAGPTSQYGSGSLDSTHANDSTQTRDSTSQTTVVLVVAGIIAAFALVLIIICVLRRHRNQFDEFDEMESPAARYDGDHTAILASPGAKLPNRTANYPKYSMNGSPIRIDTFDSDLKTSNDHESEGNWYNSATSPSSDRQSCEL